MLVDCLTSGSPTSWSPAATRPRACDRLLAALVALAGPVVLVSNEVGLGIVPLGAMSRAFVDQAGRLHQRIAAVADWVRFMAAGLPLDLKAPADGTPSMHLLSAQPAATADVEAAVDLGQTPGEIVVLSAADTELACLADARARLPGERPSLRLANLLQLAHPLSVDLYVERVVARARLVVVRLLGGGATGPTGWSRSPRPAARGVALACLPGDDRADPGAGGAVDRGRPRPRTGSGATCVHGGVGNAEQALRYAAALLGTTGRWREPQPLPRAGLYRPALPRRTWRASWPAGGAPRALLVFYRALVQSGDLAPIDALLRALAAAGLDAAGPLRRQPQGRRGGRLVRGGARRCARP